MILFKTTDRQSWFCFSPRRAIPLSNTGGRNRTCGVDVYKTYPITTWVLPHIPHRPFTTMRQFVTISVSGKLIPCVSGAITGLRSFKALLILYFCSPYRLDRQVFAKKTIGGFEPPIAVLQTAALTVWLYRLKSEYCFVRIRNTHFYTSSVFVLTFVRSCWILCSDFRSYRQIVATRIELVSVVYKTTVLTIEL